MSDVRINYRWDDREKCACDDTIKNWNVVPGSKRPCYMMEKGRFGPCSACIKALYKEPTP